ncbi:glucose-fructose oxidoreductase domain-containing protein 1 [Agrilus planipennis]|uniref:Glucose-fructose oxidoreductase domain-containing protein 1 n=1 Tax=Agrilus planipennis TaxID=224129 RepID=A0A1W4XGH3_AGRPL|nr:glucose-fructose oxidoreductase domain-containing protein 1 [Agrilus planipennis]
MLPGIGVFGTGPLVKILVPILNENGFKVEAIWSKTMQDAKDAAKELNVSFFTNQIDDVLLLKEVDLIFVLCAPFLHAQISVKALGIGKHVVCDRPAGLSQSDALRMVKAGQYYPSLISLINYSFRFLPAFMHMQKAINEGYLISNVTLIEINVQCSYLYGTNEMYNWQCDDLMGGGILNLVGSHVIDLVSFLTNKRALRVNAVMRTFTHSSENINGIRYISAPDFCTFQMDLEDSVLVCVTLKSHQICNSYQQEVMVSSNSGYLVVRGEDLFGCQKSGREEVLYCVIPNTSLSKPFTKGLFKMVAALKEAFLPVKERAGWIKEPVNLAANFEDGLYVQAVLSALKESSRTLQWIRVKIMAEQPDTDALLSAAVRKTAIAAS